MTTKSTFEKALEKRSTWGKKEGKITDVIYTEAEVMKILSKSNEEFEKEISKNCADKLIEWILNLHRKTHGGVK